MSLFNKKNLEQQQVNLWDQYFFSDFASLYPSTFNIPTSISKGYWSRNIYDKIDYWNVTDEVTDEQVNKKQK